MGESNPCSSQPVSYTHLDVYKRQPGVSMVNFMRAAVNEQRKYKGLPALTASEFLKLMREKRAVVEFCLLYTSDGSGLCASRF